MKSSDGAVDLRPTEARDTAKGASISKPGGAVLAHASRRSGASFWCGSGKVTVLKSDADVGLSNAAGCFIRRTSWLPSQLEK